jgi:hypothetical protein
MLPTNLRPSCPGDRHPFSHSSSPPGEMGVIASGSVARSTFSARCDRPLRPPNSAFFRPDSHVGSNADRSHFRRPPLVPCRTTHPSTRRNTSLIPSTANPPTTLPESYLAFFLWRSFSPAGALDGCQSRPFAAQLGRPQTLVQPSATRARPRAAPNSLTLPCLRG